MKKVLFSIVSAILFLLVNTSTASAQTVFKKCDKVQWIQSDVVVTKKGKNCKFSGPIDVDIIEMDPQIAVLRLYRPSLFMATWHGGKTVRVVIDLENSKVEKVEAVSGNPFLRQFALDAAKKSKFYYLPFIKSSKKITIDYTFNIH